MRKVPPALLQAAGLGLCLAAAPAPTLSLVVLNLLVRSDVFHGLTGRRRRLMFLLMNTVLCLSMGLVSTAYSNPMVWMSAALLLTWSFGGSGSRYDDVIDAEPVR